MTEETDEVKVFRNETEEEELDAADVSQLAEDKKDVVLEAELESRSLETETPTVCSTPQLQQQNNGFSPFPAFNNQSFNMMAQSFMLAARLSPACYPYGGMPMQPQPFMAPLSPMFPMQMQNQMNFQNLLAFNPMQQIMNPFQMPNFGASTSAFSQVRQTQTVQSQERESAKSKEPRQKRPMNSYFFYKKEYRLILREEEEFKNKQESEMNAELAKRWNSLPQEEKQRYIDMAKLARDEHKEKYPDWSAKENYGQRIKKKKKKGDEEKENKKCRARFGTENKEKWCRNCNIKKKCSYAEGSSSGVPFTTGPSTPQSTSVAVNNTFSVTSLTDLAAPSIASSPMPMEQNNYMESESDEESEEDDDPLLTRQAFQEMQSQQI